MIEIEGKYATAAVFTSTLEASVPRQIQALCDQNFA